MRFSFVPACVLLASTHCASRDLPETPRKYWSVQAFLIRTHVPGEYALRVQKSPDMAFTYTVVPSNVRPVVRDHRGRIVPGIIATVTDEMPAPGLDFRPEGPEPGTRYLRVRLDEWRLSPGMYQVGARVRVTARDAATGSSVSIPEAAAMPSLFYKTPEPEFAPALLPGRKFLFLPQNRRDLVAPAPPGTPPYPPDPDDPTLPRPPRRVYVTPYTDENGGPPPPVAALVLKVFTLRANEPAEAGKRALTFSVEGLPNRLQIVTDESATDLPHLYPILLDENARRMNARYEGRRVWSGGGAACVTDDPGSSGDFGFDSDVPVRVRRVVRVRMPGQVMGIGGAPGYMGPRESEFTFDNPIIAVVEVPRSAPVQSLSWSGFGGGVGDEDFDLQSLTALCAGTYMAFADAWDMEREMSLEDPRAARARWPARFRKAAAEGEIVKGMTPDMVAATLGWPGEYATPEEMRRWDAWRYDSTPPYNYWVYFRKGRVVGFGPDGRLP